MKNKEFRVQLALYILLFVSCSLWLFQGIIGWKRIIFLVISVGFIILLSANHTPTYTFGYWIMFLLPIIASLIINHAISSWIMYYVLMYLMIILYGMFVQGSLTLFKPILGFIAIMGSVNAIMVVTHFFLKEQFNNWYFPFLKYDGAELTASSYYDRGYYFGFNYKPHETAGLIIFAIAIFSIWALLQTEYRKKWSYVLCILFLFPLFLTGTKSITLCMGIVLMLMVISRYASKKEWKKLGIIVLCGALGVGIILIYILTHLNDPIFYRFSLFFTNLAAGKSVGAGRGDLRNAAWQLWKEHKIFGVGWYQFNQYTVSRFGFSRTHSVNLDYLQFLCETGLIGFVLMISPIIYSLWQTIICWKRILKDNTSTYENWIVLFAIFVQLFIVLYAFFEVPFYNIMYFTIYILSGVIINTYYHKAK